MDSSDGKINRREFLQKGAVAAAGSATLSATAPVVCGAFLEQTTESRWAHRYRIGRDSTA